jgi:hypothetical protein
MKELKDAVFEEDMVLVITKIVTEHLFRKLYARWVPKQLTPEDKTKRMESALTFLQRYHDDEEFLDRIRNQAAVNVLA